MEKKQKKQKQQLRGCKTLELVPMGDCIMPRRYDASATSYFLKAPCDINVPARSVKSISLNFGLRLPKDTMALILQSNETQCGVHGIGNVTKTRRRWLLFKKESTHIIERNFNAHVQASVYDASSAGSSVEVHLLNLDEGFLILKGTIIAQMMIVGVNTPFIFKREERNLDDTPLIMIDRGRTETPRAEAEAAAEQTDNTDDDGISGSVPDEG